MKIQFEIDGRKVTVTGKKDDIMPAVNILSLYAYKASDAYEAQAFPYSAGRALKNARNMHGALDAVGYYDDIDA